VPINIKNISTEFLAKLLGWIYIFAFVFILGCYIYGLFGVFNKKSNLQPKKCTQRGVVESLKYDEGKLTSIVWIRCAIEKYIVQEGKLPQSLHEEELRVGTTNSSAGWLADRSGITYRVIESSSEKNELICPESNSDCEKLIADKDFFLYELCANFEQDFGDEERALIRNPSESSFPSSDFCGGGYGYNIYKMNPKHSKGRYCYIFYAPKEEKSYPSFMKNILRINLGLQVLIFILLLFQPSYFGILMNFLMLWKFLFVYHLIASVILIFIRLVVFRDGQTNFIPRAIIGIFSICTIILSIVNPHNWSPFNYPYKISTLLYVWAKGFPIRSTGIVSIFLAILFSIVSWKEFKLELRDRTSKN